ncbi:MAG TPA: rod shape-determining protein MreD [Chitinophagaceae bacterium]|nr:rod shape-determining protein MreD [Chitinophagaceae bacterium]
MSDLLRNIIRLFVFILVQVLVLNQIPALHYSINPYLYFLFILWLPFSFSRIGLMIFGFITGFTLDAFTHTPGLHAAPCVLIAYLRPFLINILIPQKGGEMNYREPSVKSLGPAPYATYVILLTFIHHGSLFILEAWQFSNVWYLLVKTLTSSLVSLLLIIIVEMLFSRKQKFITNT